MEDNTPKMPHFDPFPPFASYWPHLVPYWPHFAPYWGCSGHPLGPFFRVPMHKYNYKFQDLNCFPYFGNCNIGGPFQCTTDQMSQGLMGNCTSWLYTLCTTGPLFLTSMITQLKPKFLFQNPFNVDALMKESPLVETKDPSLKVGW